MDSRLMKATSIRAAQDTADGVKQLHERMATLEAQLAVLIPFSTDPARAAAPFDAVKEVDGKVDKILARLDAIEAALRAPAAAPEPTHEASREGRRR